MRTVGLVSVMLALGLCWGGTAQAHDFRLVAFALTCFVPLTPDLHTRAVLVGKIEFAHRKVRVFATCFDGLSAFEFPEVHESDGEVKALDLSVVTTLEDGNQQRLAKNRCRAEARNGFLTFRCTASEAHGGDVDVLMSIAPLTGDSVGGRTDILTYSGRKG